MPITWGQESADQRVESVKLGKLKFQQSDDSVTLLVPELSAADVVKLYW